MAKIGSLLISKGYITPEQLDIALKEAHKTDEIIGKTLLRLKLVTQEQLLEALSEQLGLKFYPNLKDIYVAPEVISAIPVKFVLHYKFMPLKIKDKVLTIAISNPWEVWPAEDLKLHYGYDVERVLAPDEEIMALIKKYYGMGADTVDKIIAQDATVVTQKAKREDIEDLEKGAQDVSVIQLVNQVLSEAVTSRATDVHIEQYRDTVKIRYRIDGLLYDVPMPEQIKYLYQAIISRVKIISNLDVVERRLPQDGRAIIKIEDKQVDLRISIIPSLYGENVVIRILPVHLLFRLENLGLSPEDMKKIGEIIEKPHGIIFLTGPTGSGKTTTLYTCLTKLNKEDVKIITIEDPIEYEIKGIMQIQIKPEIGFTFANALRSILRHDPDIMMVGEVRDLETAELAIQTALTGHLIFSSLHTNDAASGATRLLDIGIEPYLIASSVNAFISQRLVRLICPDCKEERVNKEGLPGYFRHVKLYHGRGCEKCKMIGYRDRIAIYEILVIDDDIRELIINKATASQIEKRAKEKGFKTLLDSGIEKIKAGLTTPEEVLRVVELVD